MVKLAKVTETMETTTMVRTIGMAKKTVATDLSGPRGDR